MAHRPLFESAQVVRQSPRKRSVAPDDSIFGHGNDQRDPHGVFVRPNVASSVRGLTCKKSVTLRQTPATSGSGSSPPSD